jgi:hypothetical protein
MPERPKVYSVIGAISISICVLLILFLEESGSAYKVIIFFIGVAFLMVIVSLVDLYITRPELRWFFLVLLIFFVVSVVVAFVKYFFGGGW